jgi:hypothetical protein
MRHCDTYDLGGITAGNKMVTNLSGECVGADFSDIFFFPEATANVLSWAIVADKYKIDWDQNRRVMIVHVPGFAEDSFVWHERLGGLYVCDFSFLLDNEDAGRREEALKRGFAQICAHETRQVSKCRRVNRAESSHEYKADDYSDGRSIEGRQVAESDVNGLNTAGRRVRFEDERTLMSRKAPRSNGCVVTALNVHPVRRTDHLYSWLAFGPGDAIWG